MKVAKWGNSLAIRLPKPVVDVMGLKEGDDLSFSVAQTGQVTVAKEGDRHAWVESLRKYEGRLPADFKFDRDEASGRG
jgi:antitoxin MazE